MDAQVDEVQDRRDAAPGRGELLQSHRFRVGAAAREQPRRNRAVYRSYLGPFAAGAANVVGHPGRLVHAGAGRESWAGGALRPAGRMDRAGCPRTGTSPPAAGLGELASRLPSSKPKPKTTPPLPHPAASFPRPPKAEARRARLCPPPALRGRRGVWGGNAQLRSPRPAQLPCSGFIPIFPPTPARTLRNRFKNPKASTKLEDYLFIYPPPFRCSGGLSQLFAVEEKVGCVLLERCLLSKKR